MTPTSGESKSKGKAPSSAKAKRPSAARKATSTTPAKTMAKAAPKPPKVPKLAKLKRVPGGPKPLNTLKQIQGQLLKSQIKHRVERELEDADELPIKYADPTLNESDFIIGSEAAMTWGDAATEGGHAPKSARVGRGLTGAKRRMAAGVRFVKKKKVTHVGALAPAFAFDESDIDSSSDDENDTEIEKILAEKEEQEKVKTFGGRLPFLQLPREIRELVYGYLLVKDKPIEVHGNWSATYPFSAPAFAHAILGVNRAINREASKFLAMANTFHALVRRAMPDWKHNNKIDERYIADFRNIIVEIMDKNVSENPEARLTCQTLERLKKADSPIHSLILILEPYRMQGKLVQTLQALDSNASEVAYADWFKKGTEIHRLLACHGGLRCRELFFVVKLKSGGLGGQEHRVVIHIDARRLPQNFVRCKITAGNKQRLIAFARAARAEVEQVAEDLEWLTLLITMEMSLDDIRVKFATYEADRINELDGHVDDALPRLRLMERDEEIADLKWWSRKLKAIKKAAKDNAMKDLSMEMTTSNIDYVEDIEGLAPPVIPSYWLDDQSEQMGDIQRLVEDVSFAATAAPPPSSSNVNFLNPATDTPLEAMATSAPSTYTFISCEYESSVIASMRERKERLAFSAADCELSYTPNVSASVPSVAQAQQSTISGVLADLANSTTEKVGLTLEVKRGRKGPCSSMQVRGDWVPEDFSAVDEDAGYAAGGPFSSMKSDGNAILKGFKFASSSLAANARWKETGEESLYATSGEAAAANAIIAEDPLFFTEADDAAMAQSQLRGEVAPETSATTPIRNERGLFFTEEENSEVAQSIQLKEVGVGEKIATVYGVGTTLHGTLAGLSHALHEDTDGGDGDAGVDAMDELETEINAFVEELAGAGDIDADGMDQLEAEMNAEFERQLAEDIDDDGEMVGKVQKERDRKRW